MPESWHSGCARRNYRAKILYVINGWSAYANNWREIFSLNTLQAGGVFSGGLVAALLTAACTCGVITCRRCAPSTASLPDLPLARSWTLRLLLGRLLLRQTDQSLLGRHLHQSAGECREWNSARRQDRTDTVNRSRSRVLQFLLLTWLLGRKKFDGQVWGQFHDPVWNRALLHRVLRDDPGRGEVFGGLMTGTQLISILLVVGGGFDLVAEKQHSAFSTQHSEIGALA